MTKQISNLNDTFEIDPKTHWIKAFRANGDFYLIEPRAALQLGTWASQRSRDLFEAQEALDQAGKSQGKQRSNHQV